MLHINKRLIVAVVVLFILATGFFVFKNLYDNKIPKSAKLVLFLIE